MVSPESRLAIAFFMACIAARATTAQQSSVAVSSLDLVRRALRSNLSLAASRAEIQRAEARLRQVMLLPNPALDFELTTGRFTGSPNEGNTTAGIAIPLELGGKRARRAGVARAEVEAARARFRERQRQLVGQVLSAYSEALASLRELEMLQRLHDLDVETSTFVEARVREGDAPPLELRLLEVEVDRLRARRVLLQGKADAALVRLRALTGSPRSDVMRVREDLGSAVPPGEVPRSLDDAIAMAIERRPDLQVARATESIAAANLGLARAQAVPDLLPFARYSVAR